MSTKPGLEAPKEIGERASLALAALHPNPANRNLAHDGEIKNLAQSIKTVGLLYPIVVKPHPEKPGQYRIIAGERRFRALKRLGIETAPCLVVSEDSGNADTIGLVENHARRNLTPLEEAAAVRGLLDSGLDPEAVARSLGRTRAWVARRSSLTELTDRWLAELADTESRLAAWPPSHLELIARFPAEVQDRMLDEYGQRWRWNIPTFRDLREVTGEYLRLIAAAPWKATDDTLVPEAGACAVCPKRSSCRPDLFQEELAEAGVAAKGDRCLDPACWNRKADTYLARRVDEVKKTHPGAIALDNSDEEDARNGNGSDPYHAIHVSETLPCRKSDPDAVAALVVKGPGIGRIKWVLRAYKEPSGNGNGNGAADYPNDDPPNQTEPPVKTLAEKREPYDRRRRQVVIDATRDRLEALVEAKVPANALALEGGRKLAASGMTAKTLVLLHAFASGNGGNVCSGIAGLEMPVGVTWDLLSELPNHGFGPKEVREGLLAMVWDLLRHCLRHLSLRLLVSPGERDNEDKYAEAERVCALLGLDLTALRSEAAEAIPYAKAWRADVDDGWQTLEAPVEVSTEAEDPAEAVHANGS